MTYLLATSFANETVTEKSFRRLKESMVIDPCKVLIWDNCYPLNRSTFVHQLCSELDFKCLTFGHNIGAYAATNYMIDMIPQEEKTVILYDGDNYPLQDNWHLALQKVVSPSVVQAVLSDVTIERELNERGHTPVEINGVKVRRPHQACCATTCAFDLDFLRGFGGMKGSHKYYGGNEIEMWEAVKGKIVYLQDFRDDKETMQALHDWQYHQYKLLYAHRGMDISFEEYLWSEPVRNDNLAKEIFG